jgi:hypothetical protein
VPNSSSDAAHFYEVLVGLDFIITLWLRKMQTFRGGIRTSHFQPRGRWLLGFGPQERKPQARNSEPCFKDDHFPQPTCNQRVTIDSGLAKTKRYSVRIGETANIGVRTIGVFCSVLVEPSGSVSWIMFGARKKHVVLLVGTCGSHQNACTNRSRQPDRGNERPTDHKTLFSAKYPLAYGKMLSRWRLVAGLAMRLEHRHGRSSGLCSM